LTTKATIIIITLCAKLANKTIIKQRLPLEAVNHQN